MERLIQFLLEFGHWFVPFSVIDPYEGGVILRLGKHQRPCKPGLNWHWPFAVERVLSCTTSLQTTTIVTFPQTIVDGAKLACRIIMSWRVVDPKKFLLEVEGGESFVIETVGPLVAEAVRSATWQEASAPDYPEKLLKLVRRRGFRWGCEIESINFLVLCPLSLREGHLYVSTDGTGRN